MREMKQSNNIKKDKIINKKENSNEVKLTVKKIKNDGKLLLHRLSFENQPIDFIKILNK